MLPTERQTDSEPSGGGGEHGERSSHLPIAQLNLKRALQYGIIINLSFGGVSYHATQSK